MQLLMSAYHSVVERRVTGDHSEHSTADKPISSVSGPSQNNNTVSCDHLENAVNNYSRTSDPNVCGDDHTCDAVMGCQNSVGSGESPSTHGDETMDVDVDAQGKNG